MPEIRKVLKLPKFDYYETHLSFLNCIFPKEIRMTPMEIKVLASFMSLEGDITTHRFGASGRKIVMGLHGISQSGLTNYILSLKKKGYLFDKGDIISIQPILNAEDHVQTYAFKIVNESQEIQATTTSTN
jgi:hypothetical protein